MTNIRQVTTTGVQMAVSLGENVDRREKPHRRFRGHCCTQVIAVKTSAQHETSTVLSEHSSPLKASVLAHQPVNTVILPPHVNFGLPKNKLLPAAARSGWRIPCIQAVDMCARISHETCPN